MNVSVHLRELDREGYVICPRIYNHDEVTALIDAIEAFEFGRDAAQHTKGLFAIRQLFLTLPALKRLIWNDRLCDLLNSVAAVEHFLVKAIYFDKPQASNWFVPYHQDLTINVAEKHACDGFVNWTSKRGLISVQPPVEYLEQTLTLRIHMDDTDEKNGALRVIPRSHANGIVRVDTLSEKKEEEICRVKRGGVMLMKPLLLHASSRSTGNSNRRVIHLELCNKELPDVLNWKERQVDT